MYLKSIELSGFKSFAKKSTLTFSSSIAGIVGPNGSGKSNTAEAFRFVLGEQSMKAMRGKRGPDLIWAGNERQAQANRARVALTFDNKQNLFDIDFEEIVVERIVHRDGANEYTINGSKVRLKDVAELLSKANIGASGHHIISQGEADRILGASAKERREMIEEALGLKTFHYKKEESEKKLTATHENMKEAQLTRRELAPQLAHLERQVKKLERARALKQELVERYMQYLGSQRLFVRMREQELDAQEAGARASVASLTESLRTCTQNTEAESASTHALAALDEQAQVLAKQKGELVHTRGRLEGQVALMLEQAGRDAGHDAQSAQSRVVPYVEVRKLLQEVEDRVHEAHTRNDTSFLHEVVSRVQAFMSRFTDEENPATQPNESELLARLQQERAEVDEALAALESEEVALATKRSDVLASMAEQRERERETQERHYALKDELRSAERLVADVARECEALARTKNELVRLEHRAQDRGVSYINEKHTLEHTQDELADIARDIERIEARLEEAGGVDESIITEHAEVKERMAFIEREVADLEHSKQSLLEILENLDSELSTRFTEGLGKINTEFQAFFSMLFDGGEAKLDVVQKQKRTEAEDEGEYPPAGGEESPPAGGKEGIEVRVQLPRKKVATLDVLSGGERALASIALIFAMSQVNPPPFIILDETDAALDEANSRRYADMVRELSKRSQLILITHNRQTMEAAGELYGVTMGSDGISKLLSVQFDEAVSVAK